jgi:hypothetical protein
MTKQMLPVPVSSHNLDSMHNVSKKAELVQRINCTHVLIKLTSNSTVTVKLAFQLQWMLHAFGTAKLKISFPVPSSIVLFLCFI